MVLKVKSKCLMPDLAAQSYALISKTSNKLYMWQSFQCFRLTKSITVNVGKLQQNTIAAYALDISGEELPGSHAIN